MVTVPFTACPEAGSIGTALLVPHAVDLSSLSAAALAALGAYVFLLVMAALSDTVSLRIPNWLTGALALAFPLAALLVRHPIDWLSHLAAGLAVFAAAAVLFMLRLIGGGDAKLLAATALWIGLRDMPSFLLLVALVGGGLALVMLLLRQPLFQATMLATVRRLPAIMQRDMPIPYGVAIALAGLLMIPVLPLFG